MAKQVLLSSFISSNTISKMERERIDIGSLILSACSFFSLWHQKFTVLWSIIHLYFSSVVLFILSGCFFFFLSQANISFCGQLKMCAWCAPTCKMLMEYQMAKSENIFTKTIEQRVEQKGSISDFMFWMTRIDVCFQLDLRLICNSFYRSSCYIHPFIYIETFTLLTTS